MLWTTLGGRCDPHASLDGRHERPGLRARPAQPGDEPPIQRVVAIVLREYGFAIDLTGIDADLQDIQTHYLDRGGAFLVIVDAGETIYGCAGLYPLDAATAEIRKMYVLPQARGLGWGRRLLRSLIGHARWRGFDRLVLETAARLGAANALYRRFGFAEYASDHLASRCDLAMELHL